MADFLLHLVERTLGTAPIARPLVAARFAPEMAMPVDLTVASTAGDAAPSRGPESVWPEQSAAPAARGEQPSVTLPLDLPGRLVPLGEVDEAGGQPVVEGAVRDVNAVPGETVVAGVAHPAPASQARRDLPSVPHAPQVSQTEQPSQASTVLPSQTQQEAHTGPLPAVRADLSPPTPPALEAPGVPHRHQSVPSSTRLPASPVQPGDQRVPVADPDIERHALLVPSARDRSTSVPPEAVSAPGPERIAALPTSASAALRPVIAAVPQAVSGQSRSAEPGEATPTIQISIGRIEVRAVHPPAPPSRPATPATPKVSLEDYLRAQQGGRR